MNLEGKKQTENPLSDEEVAQSQQETGAGAADGLSTSLLVEGFSLDDAVRQTAQNVANIESGLDGRVRKVFGQLTEAPTNWHQATVFFFASEAVEDAEMRAKAPRMAIAGGLIILFQITTAFAISTGSILPACIHNEQCPSGQWCQSSVSTGKAGTCQFCGEDVPLPLQYPSEGNTWNNPYDPNYSGWNKTALAELCANPVDSEGTTSVAANYYTAAEVTNWCDNCHEVETGNVRMMTWTSRMEDNVAAMGVYDWVALSFALFIVSLSVVGELKDIELCSMALEHTAGDGLNAKWRTFLKLCQHTRRWVFLPYMLMGICSITVIRGGDALTACFNTLAVLFLAEVDNAAYTFGLSERARARVEAHGRVVLSDTEAKAMVYTKEAHVIIVIVVCLIAIAGMGSMGNFNVGWAFFFLFLPVSITWFGGLAEAFGPGVRAEERFSHCLKMTRNAILSMGSFVALTGVKSVAEAL
eukprot:COSAG05_NODE_1509_length_4688_cov_77.656788_2_plen_471_part_00